MIGIIPAAGYATRIHGLPKMLLPVDEGTLISRQIKRMEQIPERLRIRVGTREVYSDILADHIDARGVVVYEVETRTMSETVLAAREFAVEWERENILFGMPDTYFEDDDAFVKLAAELKDGADVAVGVFATRPEQRHKLGMVEFSPGGEVLHVIDKPAATDLTWAWGVLAWKPRFWDLLDAKDPHVGYALPRALAAELDVRAVKMEGGFWDAGTPSEYFDLISYLHQGIRA